MRGRRGAVASPHHLATDAGLDILRAGGSAVDAAITVNAVLAVVAGYDCGLGGDAFWLIWDSAAAKAMALNGSGRAGSGAKIEAARAMGYREIPERGPWSVTVPGAVHSWGAAHGRYGRLGWADLMAPAIDLAAEGFAAGEMWVAQVERGATSLGEHPDWARVYRPAGRAWRPGATVRLPALAQTLRLLAAEGPEAAYAGSLGRRTTMFLRAAGAPFGHGDLAAHRSDWGEPIAVPYRGLMAMSHPPNSCGVVALQTLRMLELLGAPDGAFDGRGWSDPGWVHLGLEASRLALAERDRHLTDGAAMDAALVEAMLSPERAAVLAGRIDARRALPPEEAVLATGSDTAYIATADDEGGLVSLLASNFRSFGSGLVDPATGIVFHDRGAFFRLDPDHPNALAPGKRTTHTLSPGMLMRDGHPWIAHGSMGGEIQPQVFAQFVSAVVDGGADIATAIAAPRWAARMPEPQAPATRTELESRMHPSIEARLRELGHAVDIVGPWAPEMGRAHAIEVVRPTGEARVGGEPRPLREDVTYAAAHDPRSEGSAVAW
ncbi:gamma-glutamyltransferase [soil metagenome]